MSISTINITTATDVYAFVGWIATICVYIVFLIWAFATEDMLHNYGITYYPSKYYASALPAYVIVIYILSGVTYIGINMFNTFDPDDIRTVIDDQSRFAPSEFIRCGPKDSIPDIGDMDPSEVTLHFSSLRKTSRNIIK